MQHMARVKAAEIPKLTRDIDGYQGALVTRIALPFMALTFVRTKEMIRANGRSLTKLRPNGASRRSV